MDIEISEFAQKELDDAVVFYEVEQNRLGLRFRDEVRKAIDRIKMFPKTWPIERCEVRKCFVHKFPYSIQKDKIVILAIAHQHRKPGYWIEEQ